MQLEQVAAPGRARAPPGRRQVVHGGEQPALVDADAQQPVVERRPPSSRGYSAVGAAARRPAPGRPRRAYGPALKVSAAGRRRRPAPLRPPISALSSAADPRVGLPRLAVHPGDRRAGQDVVELVQQHGLPDPVQRVVRVGGATSRRPRSPHHSSASRSRCSLRRLPASSPPARCTWRGAAPGTARRPTPAPSRVLGLGRGEERRPAARSRTRGEPSRSAVRRAPGEHLAGRAAAAVAVPEGHQRPGRRALVAEVARGVRQLAPRTARRCRCRPAGSG